MRSAFLALLLGLTCSSVAFAQASAAEHESHHPDAAAQTTPSTAPTDASPGASAAGAPPGGQGMMEGMQRMMEGMMGGGRKELYPFLMSLPVLTPENRVEVERLAEERIHEGSTLLQAAHERLSKAVETGDHDAAASALQQTRDGIARIDSGVAAHRLIREGAPPQALALQWFKRELDLAPAGGASALHGVFGLSWFHYAMMLILAAFAAMMLGIYIHRARRATALLAKLASGQAPRVAAAAAVPESGAAAGGPAASLNLDIAPSKPNSWTGPLRVTRIFQETAQVKTFRLADPAGGRLPFNYLPGQFLTFTVTPHGQAIKRSYTIASSPTHRDYCEVTVRHEDRGLVSGYLHDGVHEGELLQVTAPSGKFTFAGQDGSSIVLVAGGVGVTPMMSVIRYLTDRSWPGDIYLIYGCKADDDVIYREEIAYLTRRYPNLHVTLIAERAGLAGWPHRTGRITPQLLAEAVPDIASRHVHLCGPTPMMDAVKPMLAGLGVPAGQIETEVFIGKERPQLPAAGPGETSSAPLKAAVVSFVRSRRTAPLPPTKTILEAAEDAGVGIEYSCRTGTCGTCKVKLLSGAVTMEVEDGLEPADKAQNVILACQAKATDDVSVDA